MPRKPPAQDAVDYALAGLKAGRSLRDIAADITAGGYPVTQTTVKRWGERYGAELPPLDRPMPPSGLVKTLSERRSERTEAVEQEAGLPDVSDTLGAMKAMLAANLQEAKVQQGINPKFAQQLASVSGKLVNDIARLERAQVSDADVLRISRSSIREAMASVTEKVIAKIRERYPHGLMCTESGRELAISLSEPRRE